MNDISQNIFYDFGITGSDIFYNLPKPQLFKAAIRYDRGRISKNGGYNDQKAYETQAKDQGPLIFLTDPDCTGRPVNDTYAVAWSDLESKIWWKDSLQQYDPIKYQQLLKRVVRHLNENPGRLFIQDVQVGHGCEYSIPYRIISQYATHALFAQNMFISPLPDDQKWDSADAWTMLNVQTFVCDPERDGCRSERAAIIDFRNRICLVAGRADYCGLVKKSIFTAMNYLLPNQGILSMHSSANMSADGESAVLFGLSGTGKTTLSADPNRKLIGDDEIGWSNTGISNIENGCYAKLINLDKELEPIIAGALSKKGILIENVPPLPDRDYSETDSQDLDLFDDSITENTRISYELSLNPDVAEGAQGSHPTTIVMLTADAFGVLPPISVLDEDEAIYHFVQGFTARVAGTEIGVSDPEATFSSCFGEPFMAHKPMVYAKLLKEKIRTHRARCVLLNTGWLGGPATRAPRISIRDTRALLNAAIRGDFDLENEDISYKTHPILNLRFPTSCRGVDSSILDPRGIWRDKAKYDRVTRSLRDMFRSNFEKNNFQKQGVSAII